MAISYSKSDFLPNFIIKTDSDSGQTWTIPSDPANSDYQAYLASLAANSAPTAQ